MRTGEFIKMLEQADPTGEGYIMIDGDVPRFFEQKPGYYDGAYSFIDESGRLAWDTTENKVDVSCKERAWVIWDDLDQLVRKDMAIAVEKELPYHFDSEHWFEKAKELFIFDDTVTEHYKKKFFKEIKEIFDEWREYRVASDKEWADRTLKEYAQGDRFFQEKTAKKEYGYARTLKVGRDGEDDGLCGGTIQAIRYSGAFKRIEHDEERWQWVPKE